jgi:hypothetical protein
MAKASPGWLAELHKSVKHSEQVPVVTKAQAPFGAHVLVVKTRKF